MNHRLHARALTALLLLAGWAAAAPAADIAITVDDAALPVGGSTVLRLYLDPDADPVSGLGATVTYDPAALAVEYAGVEPGALGGPAQAVRLVRVRPGRVVFGGARPGGAGYRPAVPEPALRLHLRRLSGTATRVVLEDPFTLAPGSPVPEPVAPSEIVFGIVSGDSDGDGMTDTWEYLHFGGLGTAGPGTDFDGDGADDLDEFLAGTPPRVPYLTVAPLIGGLGRSGWLRVVVTLPTEPNVTYRVQRATSPAAADWTDVAVALDPGGAAVHESFTGSGGDHTVEVPAWGGGPHFFRIVVRGR